MPFQCWRLSMIDGQQQMKRLLDVARDLRGLCKCMITAVMSSAGGEDGTGRVCAQGAGILAEHGGSERRYRQGRGHRSASGQQHEGAA